MSLPSDLEAIEKLVRLSVDLHNLNGAAQRQFGISFIQWLILRKVGSYPGISAGNLAHKSGIHPSTLTPSLQRLEAQGLLHVRERPNDLRQKMIIISRKGYQMIGETEKQVLALTRLLPQGIEGAAVDASRLWVRGLFQAIQDIH